MRAEALALSLLAFSACTGKTAETQPTDASKQDEVQPTSKPKPRPAPTAMGGDGIAYIAVHGRGIAKLDASGWSTIVDDQPSFFAAEMFLGGDGIVYVATLTKLEKIVDDSLVVVFEEDHNFSTTNMVPSNDGSELFGVAGNQHGIFTGGKWVTTEFAGVTEIGTSMAVAGDGTVWIGTRNGRLFFNQANAGTWTRFYLSWLGDEYIGDPSSSPTGKVFVTNGKQLFELTPEKAETFELAVKEPVHMGYRLAYNAQGHVLAASTSCELVRVDPANPDEQWTVTNESYDCLQVDAIGLDGQGRAWVASREGLSVIGPDKTAMEYPSSTVMELVGYPVTDIVVLGKGPALPAPGPIRSRGVTGKVIFNGRPATNVRLEMCTSPSSTQACANSKIKFVGTTDDEGEFTFENVPIAHYALAVEISDLWFTDSVPLGKELPEHGATFDVGLIEVSTR